MPEHDIALGRLAQAESQIARIVDQGHWHQIGEEIEGQARRALPLVSGIGDEAVGAIAKDLDRLAHQQGLQTDAAVDGEYPFAAGDERHAARRVIDRIPVGPGHEQTARMATHQHISIRTLQMCVDQQGLVIEAMAEGQQVRVILDLQRHSEPEQLLRRTRVTELEKEMTQCCGIDPCLGVEAALPVAPLRFGVAVDPGEVEIGRRPVLWPTQRADLQMHDGDAPGLGHRAQRRAIAPAQDGLDVLRRVRCKNLFEGIFQAWDALGKQAPVGGDRVAAALRQQGAKHRLAKEAVQVVIHLFARGHLVLQTKCVGRHELPALLRLPVLGVAGIVFARDEQHALAERSHKPVVNPQEGCPIAAQGEGQQEGGDHWSEAPGHDTWIGACTTPTCSRGDQKRR